MRQAEEDGLWEALKRRHEKSEPREVTLDGISLDLAEPCTVLGGRNGAGKSRLLKALKAHLAEDSLYVDLYHLCEQALTVLRSRDDFGEMAQEYQPLGPDEKRLEDLQRIIGREYERVAWYALEVDFGNEAVADRFLWGGDQTLLPYFDVLHRGVNYTSRDMGLGEYSVHFLFWILEQYREAKDLILLLDEPDAYLPPVGVSGLLNRLLRISLERGWRIVVSTHSSEMISRAREEKAFLLLSTDRSGTATAVHCREDPSAGDSLLEQPPVRHVLFVEDECAHMLTTVLVERLDRRLARSVEVVWGGGSGYLMELQKHLPRSPRPEISFLLVFDGDMREHVSKSNSNRWPALFLPTDRDPDELFRQTREVEEQLASRLQVPTAELAELLDSLEGLDSHDWVIQLAGRFGRQHVLRVLSETWVDANPDVADGFLEELSVYLQ